MTAFLAVVRLLPITVIFYRESFAFPFDLKFADHTWQDASCGSYPERNRLLLALQNIRRGNLRRYSTRNRIPLLGASQSISRPKGSSLPE